MHGNFFRVHKFAHNAAYMHIKTYNYISYCNGGSREPEGRASFSESNFFNAIFCRNYAKIIGYHPSGVGALPLVNPGSATALYAEYTLLLITIPSINFD